LTITRFIQLFVCYFISILIAVLLTNLFHFSNQWLEILVISIIGYIVLTIPLTILTIVKSKK